MSHVQHFSPPVAATPVRVVKGPDGAPMCINDLPLAGPSLRWTPIRKAIVLTAVKGGLISISDVCERYGLGMDELGSWEAAYAAGGLDGLKLRRMAQRRRRSDDDGMIG